MSVPSKDKGSMHLMCSDRAILPYLLKFVAVFHSPGHSQCRITPVGSTQLSIRAAPEKSVLSKHSQF